MTVKWLKFFSRHRHCNQFFRWVAECFPARNASGYKFSRLFKYFHALDTYARFTRRLLCFPAFETDVSISITSFPAVWCNTALGNGCIYSTVWIFACFTAVADFPLFESFPSLTTKLLWPVKQELYKFLELVPFVICSSLIGCFLSRDRTRAWSLICKLFFLQAFFQWRHLG